MDTVGVQEVQQQIGSLRERGAGSEPFIITVRHAPTLICLPVIGLGGVWRDVVVAVLACLRTTDDLGPNTREGRALLDAVRRLRFYARLAG